MPSILTLFQTWSTLLQFKKSVVFLTHKSCKIQIISCLIIGGIHGTANLSIQSTGYDFQQQCCFLGEAGSGKSEIALNFAQALAELGGKPSTSLTWT